MKYDLLSASDLEAIDALKEHHGGPLAISQTIRERRSLETRKKLLQGTPFADLVADAEELVTRFPKIEDFESGLGHRYRDDFGVATAQVSGFQGARVTHRSMQRMVESATTGEPFASFP